MKIRFNHRNIDLDDIEIKDTKDIPAKQLQNLYLSVGWHYRSCIDIQKSITNSLFVISAWSQGSLIGIARATGDGIFNAMIWDMAVKKEFQGLGVGKKIMKTMLTKIDDCDISLITLYSEYTNKNFYSKLGFEFDPNRIIGMYRVK